MREKLPSRIHKRNERETIAILHTKGLKQEKKDLLKWAINSENWSEQQMSCTYCTLDEIIQYLIGRLISSNEAIGHNFIFSIQKGILRASQTSSWKWTKRVLHCWQPSRKQQVHPTQHWVVFFLWCQQDPFARTVIRPYVPKSHTSNVSEAFRKRICKAFLLQDLMCVQVMPWDRFTATVSENILREHHRANPDANFCSETFDRALILVEYNCIPINNKALQKLGLKAPTGSETALALREILREKSYKTWNLNR